MLKTLEDLRAGIEEEIPKIDIRPYGRGLINLYLQRILDNYGKEKADETIAMFELEEHGWLKT